jgi:PPP family 3-phenylpropionic acid transporter
MLSARGGRSTLFKAFAVHINEPVAYVLLYAAMYAAFGVASPFWPKFFETRSIASEQIGYMLGAAMLVRLLAGPAVGRLADVSKSWRLVLAICAALAAAMAVALLLANTFWLLFLVASLQAAALAPTTSIADALSVNAAKPQIAGKPFEYGWIRGAASAAFMLGTLIMGQLVSRTDFNPIIWMNAALLLATAAATALLPKPNTEAERNTGPSAGVDSVRGLLRISGFRVLILVSALVLGSHAMHDAFALIRWSDAGMDGPVISILWSEAVAAEVIVFLVIGPALLDRIGTRYAAALAAVAGVLRWSVAGLTTSFVALSIVQPLHGLTFALLHLACMRMMGILVPINLCATAQTFYAFGSGITTAALTLLSGVLYGRYGGGSFFTMALLCGIALPFAWFGFANNRLESYDGSSNRPEMVSR